MSFPSLKSVRGMRLLQPSGLPIGVDFGVGSLKLLQLSCGDQPTLISADAVPTPDELLNDASKRIDFQIEAFAKVAKKRGFRGKRAICSIPGANTFCKHLVLTKSDGVRLESLVAAEVAREVGCRPESLVCQHIEIPGTTRSSTPGKLEVVCMAVGREIVNRLTAAFSHARCELVGIQPECLAVIRAFDDITRRDSDAKVSTLYLDIGHGATNVIIAHGRDVVFTKSIQIGGLQFDAAIAERFRCTLAHARARRMACAEVVPPVRMPVPVAEAVPVGASARDNASAVGDAGAAPDRRLGQHPPGLSLPVDHLDEAGASPPGVDLSEPLDCLADEVAMCLRYYESMFPWWRINRTIFVGGESKNRGLCQYIARRLKVGAQVADPLARVARTGKEPCSGVDLSEPQPGWAVPVGLCMSPSDF